MICSSENYVSLRAQCPVHVGQVRHVFVQRYGRRQLQRVNCPRLVVGRGVSDVAARTLTTYKAGLIG